MSTQDKGSCASIAWVVSHSDDACCRPSDSRGRDPFATTPRGGNSGIILRGSPLPSGAWEVSKLPWSSPTCVAPATPRDSHPRPSPRTSFRCMGGSHFTRGRKALVTLPWLPQPMLHPPLPGRLSPPVIPSDLISTPSCMAPPAGVTPPPPRDFHPQPSPWISFGAWVMNAHVHLSRFP